MLPGEWPLVRTRQAARAQMRCGRVHTARGRERSRWLHCAICDVETVPAGSEDLRDEHCMGEGCETRTRGCGEAGFPSRRGSRGPGSSRGPVRLDGVTDKVNCRKEGFSEGPMDKGSTWRPAAPVRSDSVPMPWLNSRSVVQLRCRSQRFHTLTYNGSSTA